MKEIFFNTNAIAALFGWLAWTCIMLSVYKDENEKTFNIQSYAQEHWDNWLASLVAIPVLLYIGYKQLGLGMINMESVHWSDAYYIGSGFAVELVKVAWKKWQINNKA